MFLRLSWNSKKTLSEVGRPILDQTISTRFGSA